MELLQVVVRVYHRVNVYCIYSKQSIVVEVGVSLMAKFQIMTKLDMAHGLIHWPNSQCGEHALSNIYVTFTITTKIVLYYVTVRHLLSEFLNGKYLFFSLKKILCEKYGSI